jgi:hypothetical protein
MRYNDANVLKILNQLDFTNSSEILPFIPINMDMYLDDIIKAYSSDKLFKAALYCHEEGNQEKLLKSALDSGSDLKNECRGLLNLYNSVKRFFTTLKLKTIVKTIIDHPNSPFSPQEILDAVIKTPSNNLNTNYSSHDGMEIKQQIADICFSKGAKIDNTLTIYHYPGHAFVSLSCQSCSNQNRSVVMYAGLYPSITEEQVSTSFGDKKNIEDNHPSAKIMDSSLLVTELTGVIIDELGFKTSGYHLSREFDFDLLPKDIHQAMNNSYGNNNATELAELAQRKFSITDEAAKKVFQVIEKAAMGDPKMSYKLLTNNCIAFAQNIYKEAGLPGNHFEQIHGYRYDNSLLGLSMTLNDIGSILSTPYKVANIVNTSLFKSIGLNPESDSTTYVQKKAYTAADILISAALVILCNNILKQTFKYAFPKKLNNLEGIHTKKINNEPSASGNYK